MRHPLLRRCLTFATMLLGVVLCTFLLIHVVPGDPAATLLGDNATPRQMAQLRNALGLDLPWPTQLARYVSGLLHGDLGQSLFRRQPVTLLIRERLPATLELAFAACTVAVVLGVASGTLAALSAGSRLDDAVITFAQLGAAVTVYWLAILLVYVFSVRLQWLPSIGRGPPLMSALGASFHGQPGPLLDALSHLVLPATAMGLQGAALLSRLVRVSLIQALASPYAQAARAVGLGEWRVLVLHAAPNALLPLIPMVALQFGGLLGGAVLVEGIFGWPGLGQLSVGALSQRDFPLIQGVTLAFALMFGAINLFADMAQAIVDPRLEN